MNIAKVLLALVLSVFPFLAMASDEGESPFYGQIALHDYHSHDGAFYGQEAYLQLETGETVAVWATGYRDSEFWSASIGISKTWNEWTVALGTGKARADGQSYTVIAPWIAYNNDQWEILLTAEYYRGGLEPFYQGYAQRRVGEHALVGIWAESGLGIGPVVTIGANKRVAMRLVVPVADKRETDVLVTLVITF